MARLGGGSSSSGPVGAPITIGGGSSGGSSSGSQRSFLDIATEAIRDRRARGEDRSGGIGGAFRGFGRGITRGALDTLNIPAYHIGSIASGDFSNLRGNPSLALISPALFDPSKITANRTFVSDTRGGQAIANRSPLGNFVTSLLIDISTDPATFVGGGLAKAPVQTAARAAGRNVPLSRARGLIEPNAADFEMLALTQRNNDAAISAARRADRGGSGTGSPLDSIRRAREYALSRLLSREGGQAPGVGVVDDLPDVPIPGVEEVVGKAGARQIDVLDDSLDEKDLLNQLGFFTGKEGEDLLDDAGRFTELFPNIQADELKDVAVRTGREAELLDESGVIQIGVRPFLGFGKLRVVAETRGNPNVFKAIKTVPGGNRLGTGLEKFFGSSGGAHRPIAEMGQAIRRSSEARKSRGRDEIAEFNDKIKRVVNEHNAALAKAGGGETLSYDRAVEQITRHLVNPQQTPLEESLQQVAEEARQFLRGIQADELVAGFSMEELPKLVPFLLASPRGAKVYKDRLQKAIDDMRAAGHQIPEESHLARHITENPWMARGTLDGGSQNLDEFDAFLQDTFKGQVGAEFNILKIMEKRLDASLDGRARKAFEDAIQEVYGIRAPIDHILSRFGGVIEEISPSLEQTVAKTNSGLLDAMKKNPELIGKGLDDEDVLRLHDDLIKDNWVHLSERFKKADSRVPVEIRDEFRKAREAMETIGRNPEELREMTAGFSVLTQLWKSLALLSPGFHVRNIFDDYFRAFVMGSGKPSAYSRGAKMMMAGEDKVFEIGGVSLTKREWMNVMEDQGVIHTGFAGSDIPSSAATRQGKVRRYVEVPGRGRLAQGSRQLGQYREDWMRSSAFLDQFEQTGDIALSARRVRDYLFDYGDVGRAVGFARRMLVPFATFTSKAIPNSIRMMLLRPGIFAMMDKIFQQSERAAGSDALTIPRYAGSGVVIPESVANFDFNPFGHSTIRELSGADEDTALFLPLQTTLSIGSLDAIPIRPPTPGGDIFSAVDESRGAAEGEIAGGLLGPVAAGPLQALTQRNFFFGRPIYEGETANQNVLTSALGIEVPTQTDMLLRQFPPYQRLQQILPSDASGPLGPFDQRGVISFSSPNLQQFDRERALDEFLERLGEE